MFKDKSFFVFICGSGSNERFARRAASVENLRACSLGLLLFCFFSAPAFGLQECRAFFWDRFRAPGRAPRAASWKVLVEVRFRLRL